jgi:Ca-activated chloride channel family protein
MTHKIVIALTAPLLLSASLLDFRALDEAKEGYAEGNYSKAIASFERLEQKSDEVLYDEANSYYKLKDYKKAKELYSAIKKESLLFNKWHNLGNCHAQLGELDEGIKAYEKALKIKEDKDTRFNLELLKKKKKEQEKKKKDDKKKDQKNKDKKKDDKKKDDKKQDKKDDKKNEDKQNDKKDNQKKDGKNSNKKDEKKPSDKKENNKDKQSDKEKKEQEKKQKEEQKKAEEKKKQAADKKKDEEKKNDKKEQAQAGVPMKKEPISDKELRKYQKMLDQRGINTLMVPLNTKGDDNHELKPW